MAHGLHDPLRHNAWATIQILLFCRRLDAHTLHATVLGTYGTIIATLRHITRQHSGIVINGYDHVGLLLKQRELDANGIRHR